MRGALNKCVYNMCVRFNVRFRVRESELAKGTPYTYRYNTETSVVYASRILDYSLSHSHSFFRSLSLSFYSNTPPAVGTTDDSPTPTAHPSMMMTPDHLSPNRYYYKYILYNITMYAYRRVCFVSFVLPHVICPQFRIHYIYIYSFVLYIYMH